MHAVRGGGGRQPTSTILSFHHYWSLTSTVVSGAGKSRDISYLPWRRWLVMFLRGSSVVHRLRSKYLLVWYHTRWIHSWKTEGAHQLRSGRGESKYSLTFTAVKLRGGPSKALLLDFMLSLYWQFLITSTHNFHRLRCIFSQWSISKLMNIIGREVMRSEWLSTEGLIRGFLRFLEILNRHLLYSILYSRLLFVFGRFLCFNRSQVWSNNFWLEKIRSYTTCLFVYSLWHHT